MKFKNIFNAQSLCHIGNKRVLLSHSPWMYDAKRELTITCVPASTTAPAADRFKRARVDVSAAAAGAGGSAASPHTFSSMQVQRDVSSTRFRTFGAEDGNSDETTSINSDEDESPVFPQLAPTTFPFFFTPDETVASVTNRILYDASEYSDFELNSQVTLFVGRTALDPSKAIGFYNLDPLDGELDIRVEFGEPQRPTSMQTFRDQSCSTIRAMSSKLQCDTPL